MLGYVLIAFILGGGIALIVYGIYFYKKGKKVLGVIVSILGIGCVWTILLPVILVLLFVFSFKPQEYLTFQEKLMSPDGTAWFSLYHDYSGIGDPDWHVFKIPNDEDPKSLKIPTAYRHTDSDVHDFWKNRMLMWNWSEAGNHKSNPHIEIHGQRYLVFIRGGYYHGLYDIEENKTLITDTSPWHSLVYSRDHDSTKSGLKLDQIDAQMDKWVEDTLHNPIKEIVEKAN